MQALKLRGLSKMAKLSKKQKLIAERIEPGKNNPIEEAVSIISEFASKKFSESLDVSINLGVDPGTNCSKQNISLS